MGMGGWGGFGTNEIVAGGMYSALHWKVNVTFLYINSLSLSLSLSLSMSGRKVAAPDGHIDLCVFLQCLPLDQLKVCIQVRWGE